MAKVEVVNEGITIEVPKGTKLREALRKTKILFGCENALCGVCCINVIKGTKNLAKMEELEEKELKVLDAEPGQRLACQAVVIGDCTIEYINEAG